MITQRNARWIGACLAVGVLVFVVGCSPATTHKASLSEVPEQSFIDPPWTTPIEPDTIAVSPTGGNPAASNASVTTHSTGPTTSAPVLQPAPTSRPNPTTVPTEPATTVPPVRVAAAAAATPPPTPPKGAGEGALTHATGHVWSPPTTIAPTPPPAVAYLGCPASIVALIKTAFGGSWQWAVGIAMRESHCEPGAANRSSTARGVFQLEVPLHARYFAAVGCTWTEWANAACNVAAAGALFRAAGRSPWAL